MPVLSACTLLPVNEPESASTQASTVVEAEAAQVGWWRVGYHWQWAEGQEPLWHLDPLIAHQLIKSVLAQHGGDIKIWRFHRRAARDAAGHQFSFIFYCTNATAKKLYALLEDNEIVQGLKNQGIIERLSFLDINTNRRPEIGDTSDDVWAAVLQQTWPYFIMGVSQTWLGLIDKLAEQGEVVNDMSITDQVERYKSLNVKISEIWEQQGGHAFLHHLNAIFGYQELFVYERKRTRY